MTGSINIVRYALGFTVVIGGFALLFCLIFYPVPLESKDILNVGLGLVLGWGSTVLGFEFGASRKSSPQEVTVANTSSDPVPVEPAR